MRRSGSKLCLIAMITATATLTACAPKGAAWNSIPGITYMLQMTVLIPIFPQKADTTRMMVFFPAVLGYGRKG